MSTSSSSNNEKCSKKSKSESSSSSAYKKKQRAKPAPESETGEKSQLERDMNNNYRIDQTDSPPPSSLSSSCEWQQQQQPSPSSHMIKSSTFADQSSLPSAVNSSQQPLHFSSPLNATASSLVATTPNERRGHARTNSRSNDKFHMLFPSVPIYETVENSELCTAKRFILIYFIIFFF
jgi:hypothetical protein